MEKSTKVLADLHRNIETVIARARLYLQPACSCASSQLVSAKLTEFCVLIMTFASTAGTCFVALPFRPRSNCHFSGDDARRHGDDTIPQQHNEARDQLSKRCSGRNVTIPDGRDSYNCPVYRLRYACKAMLFSFNQVNYRTQYNHRRQHHQDKNADLP